MSLPVGELDCEAGLEAEAVRGSEEIDRARRAMTNFFIRGL
jgi:hypothetical protein